MDKGWGEGWDDIRLYSSKLKLSAHNDKEKRVEGGII